MGLMVRAKGSSEQPILAVSEEEQNLELQVVVFSIRELTGTVSGVVGLGGVAEDFDRAGNSTESSKTSFSSQVYAGLRREVYGKPVCA